MTRLVYLTVFVISLFISYSFTSVETAEYNPAPLKWYTWEEAVAANKVKQKKIMIDIYTGWCGYCKKMDKTTFVDPKVTAYLNENFYPVKLDAEMKEDINWNGHKFEFRPDAGRRGVHTLAYSLLEGRMSYPSIVYLNEKMDRILISPGYKKAPDMLKELKFTAENKYKEMKWEDYRKMK